jgi:hypothetical protein
MAIYDFSKAEKSALNASMLTQKRSSEEDNSTASEMNEDLQLKANRWDPIFSTLAARLFFLLLVVADLLWLCYALVQMAFAVAGFLATRGKVPYFKNLSEKAWVTLRRSLVCAVSLMIALFSPTFGIMIACTYFLMYDKTGIEEVVPSSLQSQFKEFLPKE